MIKTYGLFPLNVISFGVCGGYAFFDCPAKRTVLVAVAANKKEEKEQRAIFENKYPDWLKYSESVFTYTVVTKNDVDIFFFGCVFDKEEK
jgi:hypothetical protein